MYCISDYQNEVQQIHADEAMKRAVLAAVQKKGKKNSNTIRWAAGFAVAAALFFFCSVQGIVPVSTVADAVAKAIKMEFLFVTKKQEETDADQKEAVAEPIQMKVETFCAYAAAYQRKTNYGIDLSEGEYAALFESYGEFKKTTGIQLLSDRETEVTISGKTDEKLSLSYDKNTNRGHLVFYAVVDSHTLQVNGQFTTKELGKKNSLGYGIDGTVVETYIAQNGQEAYFVKTGSNKKPGRTELFFAQHGILYQMFPNDTKKGWERAKKVVDALGW